MYVVWVELRIKPEAMEAFMPLMLQNAAASRDEPGCRQFDVLRPESDADLVLLYELYDDAQAFAAHLATAHFKAFDGAVSGMVSSKTVHTGTRLSPTT